MKVSATQFVVGTSISNMYYKKISSTGKGHYALAKFVRNKDNSHVVYCLDPFITFGENKDYSKYLGSEKQKLNFSAEVWEKVNAIAYFGYGYLNHNDDYWYAVTQILIWRTVDPTTDSFFTDKLNGNKITTYDDKINELENLVNNFLNIERKITKNVDFQRPENLALLQEQEKILSTGLINNNGYIALNEMFNDSKTYYSQIGDDSNSSFYLLDGYQRLLEVSGLPKIIRRFDLTNKRGNLFIHPNVLNDIYSNCKSNTKNIYELYDINNNKITSFELNDDIVKLDNLEYKRYYIKQVENSCNTMLDDYKYIVDLDEINENVIINIKKKTKKVNINKKYCTDDICINEENAKFIISDNNYNYELTTDENGTSSIEIGQGDYVLKQISGMDNYYFIKDFNINTFDYSSDINLTLYNKIKKYSIEVNVKDLNDNPINKSKICLYDMQDNLVKCDETIDGKIIFDNLYSKNYYLKQEGIDSNYLINNDKYELFLKEDYILIITNELIKENIINNEKSESKTNEVLNEKNIINEIIKNDEDIVDINNIEIQDDFKESNNIESIDYDTYISEINYINILIICLTIIAALLYIYEKHYN